ncbi:MAG: hypothetical protein KatS3mg038_2309 [Candidatus Kapaibacterium sp.]|nr:MAG: hypothetical protein KatS3mg038_2309 [Candidatus Kapabacteria bacterium]
MKIAVIRPNSSGWIFAAGSESSWSITLNRHNYEWWRKLVVQAHENYATAWSRRLTRPRRCTTTPPGSSSCQASSCATASAHAVGRPLISSASPAAATIDRTPWQPGDPAPNGSGIIYWSELMQLWTAIYLQMAEELISRAVRAAWPERVPQLVTARDYRAGGHAMKPIGRPIPIRVPRRRPQKRRPKKAQPKPAKVPAGKP